MRLFIAAGSKDNPPDSLTARVPSALTMVFGDELLQPLACEDRVGIRRQRRAEEAIGQRVLLRRPPREHVDAPLGRYDAARGFTELVPRHIPAGDGAQHGGRLAIEVGEDTAQELAQDQGIHERRAILGLDRVAHRLERRVASIHLVREVHFVGAAAVVIGAASADRESEGHRLQRPGLVAGDLEALHLRRERDAPPADGGRGATTALRQQVPQAFPRADQLDRLQHGIAAAKSEPRFLEESALDTLHREGDGAPGADGVDAELVAPARRAEDGVAVRDAAKRAEGEQTLVLDADTAVAQRVDVFASDRAGHAARPRPRAPGTELLRREPRRVLEGATLEIPGRQRAEAVEREEVRRSTELAVLRGGRSEGASRQIAAQLDQLAGPGPIAPLRSTDGNGFEVLAAEHRPAAATA